MQFSTDYFTQLVQRLFKAQTPKFFNIMAVFFGVVAALLLGANYLESQLAELHKTAPEWLTYAKVALRTILYVGGPLAAKSAIQTPDTPPLASDIEKPTLESQARELAELRAQIEALTPKTSFALPANEQSSITTLP